MNHQEQPIDTDEAGSRRDFLRGVSATGLAAALTGIQTTSASAAEKKGVLASNVVPANRIHVFANPFDDMPIEDGARIIAAAGYGGLGMTVRRNDLIDPEQVEDALPHAVEVCKAAGLRTEIITTQLTNPADPLAERIVRTAAKQGITYFRFGNFNYNSYSSVREARNQIRPILRDMMQLARGFGMRAAIQNHSGNGISSPVWDLAYLIEELDPFYMGFHYDSRHAMVEGTGCWTSGYGMAAPSVHVLIPKDFRWTVNTAGRASPSNQPVGGGIVDFNDFFRRARSWNINAPVEVHFAWGIFNNNTWRAPGSNRPSPEGEAELIRLMKLDLEALRPHMTAWGYGWTA